jgi:hypothetical protein
MLDLLSIAFQSLSSVWLKLNPSGDGREADFARHCIGGDVDDYVQTRISVLVCDTPLYPQPQPLDALSNTSSALLHILTMPPLHTLMTLCGIGRNGTEKSRLCV